jgi:hypothetical protein
MTQLQTRQHRTAVVRAGPSEDPFATVLRPAQPALDAIVQLKPSIDFIVANEKRRHFHLDVRRSLEFADEAAERLKVIPPLAVLRQAERLFGDAERIPAPEAWLHVALGILLAERPNAGKVSPTYRFGIVDSMLYDEEYAPGFSQPVVLRALRELRKASEFVPAPAEVLKTCARQKQSFGTLRLRTEQLIAVRENAEQILAEDRRLWEQDWGPIDDEPIPPRPPGWQPPADDVDVPF